MRKRKKENIEKVKLRVAKYRSKPDFAKIEINNITPTLKNEFLDIPAKNNANRLKMLMDLFNNSVIDYEYKPDFIKNNVTGYGEKTYPNLTTLFLNTETAYENKVTVNTINLENYKNELEFLMDEQIKKLKESIDWRAHHRVNINYWKNILNTNDNVLKALEILKDNVHPKIEEWITNNYINISSSELQEVVSLSAELQQKIVRKTVEIYDYQKARKEFLMEIILYKNKI